MTTPDTTPTTDGRHARRERGRQAVVEALIELVFEGHIPPAVGAVAERAGVSVASIFRYFDTIEDLRRDASVLYLERHALMFAIPKSGHGTLDERIQTFVGARLSLYEKNEPFARLVRLRAANSVDLDEFLQQMRCSRADQIRHHFGPELAQRSRAERDDVVTILATLTSFESWDIARNSLARSRQQLRRSWVATLRRLLAT
ncbi:MAG: AcrR family transcriptional regulator [Candidatus Poriferisodalaceae bacterium]|jgi:AcrR family transcriptional regulator